MSVMKTYNGMHVGTTLYMAYVLCTHVCVLKGYYLLIDFVI